MVGYFPISDKEFDLMREEKEVPVRFLRDGRKVPETGFEFDWKKEINGERREMNYLEERLWSVERRTKLNMALACSLMVIPTMIIITHLLVRQGKSAAFVVTFGVLSLSLSCGCLFFAILKAIERHGWYKGVRRAYEFDIDYFFKVQTGGYEEEPENPWKNLFRMRGTRGSYRETKDVTYAIFVVFDGKVAYIKGDQYSLLKSLGKVRCVISDSGKDKYFAFL